MSASEVQEILSRVRRRADSLDRLVESLAKPPPGQLRDTINRVAVEGRALTNILQNLRGKVDGFDDWYQTKQIEMASDELLRFFYQMRTESLKKGLDGVSGVELRPQPGGMVALTPEGITVEWPDNNGRRQHHYPSPPNTVGKFLGDQEGGSGFEIKMADGKTRKQYVYIPAEVANISVLFDHPPAVHREKKLEDRSPASLCRLYIRYLQELTGEAEAKFGLRS
jgi:hypothetical protein